MAISTLLLTVGIVLGITLALPKQYMAVATVYIDQTRVDPITGISLPIQLMPGYMQTHVDVIGSHNVARKVVEKLKLSDYPQMQEDYQARHTYVDIQDWLADLLLLKLKITPSRESSLIDIGFKAADPEFSALVANAFADAYMETSLELRSQPAKNNADWYNAQLASMKDRLEKAQAQLSSFQQKTGIVGIDDRLDIENLRLEDLSRQLVESQAQTSELQSRKNLLSSSVKLSDSPESLQEVLNSSLISSLKTDLARAEASFAILSKHLDKNHPQYKQSEAEINSLKQRINSEIAMVTKSISSGLSSSRQRDGMLSKALAEQKAKVLELKKQYNQIAVYSQEVENAQLALSSAMQRSAQTRMESEMSQTNISLLNPAIPPEKPSSPKLILNLVLSVFLGGVLGVAVSIGSELLDRRVRSAFDVSEALGLPVFALIPAPVVVKPKSKRKFAYGGKISPKF